MKFGLFFDSKNKWPMYSLSTPKEISCTAPRKYIGSTVAAQPGIVLSVNIDSNRKYKVIKIDANAIKKPSIPIILSGINENEVMPLSASDRLFL